MLPCAVSCRHLHVPLQEWTYPPFDGKIADGFVWGRGAMDAKVCLCVWTLLFVCLCVKLIAERFLGVLPPSFVLV